MRQKSLSFDPLVIQFAQRMLGVSSDSMKILNYEPENPKDGSYMRDMHKAMHEPLLPGPGLHAMNERVLMTVANSLNNVSIEFESNDLYLWLRDMFSWATDKALFGADSVLNGDPKLLKAFW
jgi:hypothetical protein